MKYLLTIRLVDIKKNIETVKNIEFIHANLEGKMKILKTNMAISVDPKLLELLFSDNNAIINKSYVLLEGHSEDCIKINLINLPEVKEATNEQKIFFNKVYKFFDMFFFFF